MDWINIDDKHKPPHFVPVLVRGWDDHGGVAVATYDYGRGWIVGKQICITLSLLESLRHSLNGGVRLEKLNES